MTAIHSGSSRQRLVRVSLITLMVIGFAIAYLWDGFRGYPERNRQELARLLNLDQTAVSQAVIDQKLTGTEAARRLEIIGRDKLNSNDKIVAAFGKPAAVSGGEVYYLGRGGWLKIKPQGSSTAGEWVKGGKSETDIELQRWIGIALSVLGVVLLIHLIRVLRFRVTVNSNTLKITGKPVIPLSAIKSVDAADYKKSGRVEICHEGNGAAGSVRLDDYEVMELSAIVAAICKERGIPDPLAENRESAGRS